ncbi:MAG: hypothetical protein RBU45_24615, partial [Myxococcota bacterium]|nr:hypothetical protein [Myxococcota bacterium]
RSHDDDYRATSGWAAEARTVTHLVDDNYPGDDNYPSDDNYPGNDNYPSDDNYPGTRSSGEEGLQ